MASDTQTTIDFDGIKSVVESLLTGEKEDATEELLSELKAEREGHEQTISDLQNNLEKKVLIILIDCIFVNVYVCMYVCNIER